MTRMQLSNQLSLFRPFSYLQYRIMHLINRAMMSLSVRSTPTLHIARNKIISMTT